MFLTSRTSSLEQSNSNQDFLLTISFSTLYTFLFPFADEEILAGPQLPTECHVELHTDYGGAAVRWGLTNPKESAYDCCQACLDHAKKAKPDEKICNIWVFCPLDTGCYSPDIYEDKHMECWLKYSEQPKPNFKTSIQNSIKVPTQMYQ